MTHFKNSFPAEFSKEFYADFEAFTRRQFPFLTDAGTEFSQSVISPLKARILAQEWAVCTGAISAFQKLRAHPLYIKKMTASFESHYDLPAFLEPHSLFQAYDFHLGAGGPRLIEINTNAGFAMGATFFRDFTESLPSSNFGDTYTNRAARENYWNDFIKVFSSDFSTLAIVDESPESQALYFEFLLFKDFIERKGKKVIISDPAELVLKVDGLYHQSGARVDVIYNRLTDFYFSSDKNRVLRTALKKNLVKISPHPFDFYCLADKSRMIDFSSQEFLAEFCNDSEMKAIQSVLLNTERVTAASAERLWRNRKNCFFKPFRSFGSKAVYSGRGVTKGVWEHIKTHDYIAQEIYPAGKVSLFLPGTKEMEFKFDLRFFVFGDEIRFACPRFYQGQLTNFKTPLGGFGSLVVADSQDSG